MIQVVINKCYGGFSISPEAALWLYERGMTEIATPVEEYWKDDQNPDDALGFKAQLANWREYIASPCERFCFIVFSPDEKFVLDVRPAKRDNPLLVECVKTLGKKANGSCAELAIVEIPDGVDWFVDEYDGYEHIAESHRTWR